MQWTSFRLGGQSVVHVRQDENTNQCVAASLAMICKNTGYWGHCFGEGALFSCGASAMRQLNPDVMAVGDDMQLVNRYGIRPNAVPAYLRSYGFDGVRTTNVAAQVSQAINTMVAGDCAILVCGGNQFHALAAFRLHAVTYILNPMPADDAARGFAYANIDAVEVDQGSVKFRRPTYGDEYWMIVDSCFLIPSQWYLGTVKRWLIG